MLDAVRFGEEDLGLQYGRIKVQRVHLRQATKNNFPGWLLEATRMGRRIGNLGKGMHYFYSPPGIKFCRPWLPLFLNG